VHIYRLTYLQYIVRISRDLPLTCISIVRTANSNYISVHLYKLYRVHAVYNRTDAYRLSYDGILCMRIADKLRINV
jgi:hypothetical protein